MNRTKTLKDGAHLVPGVGKEVIPHPKQPANPNNISKKEKYHALPSPLMLS